MDTYLADVVALSDEELLEELQAHGKATGPIVDSTRSAYQRMLAKLIAEQTVSKCKAMRSLKLEPSPTCVAAAASRETQQEEEEEEEEDEGVDANVSYIGEWSSDEEAEEIEVQPPPPRRMETRQSSKVPPPPPPPPLLLHSPCSSDTGARVQVSPLGAFQGESQV